MPKKMQKGQTHVYLAHVIQKGPQDHMHHICSNYLDKGLQLGARNNLRIIILAEVEMTDGQIILVKEAAAVRPCTTVLELSNSPSSRRACMIILVTVSHTMNALALLVLLVVR